MGRWYRIFAGNSAVPSPGEIQNYLASHGWTAEVRLEGDADTWNQAEIQAGPGTPLLLERFLASEREIRQELNTWAAYLETLEQSPAHLPLMEKTIQSQQLFTLQAGEDPRSEPLCTGLARFLAERTEGFYHSDGQGFFAFDGSLRIADEGLSPEGES